MGDTIGHRINPIKSPDRTVSTYQLHAFGTEKLVAVAFNVETVVAEGITVTGCRGANHLRASMRRHSSRETNSVLQD